MKKLFTFFVLFGAMAFVIGCHSGDGTGASSSNDTLYNDSIQGVFFDTPFGASREILISNFLNHGLAVINDYSTNEEIHFYPINGNLFSFGNMTWEMVDVLFSNGKFCVIRFQNAGNDKAEALNDYDYVLSKVSAKYKMSESEIQDTTVYKASYGVSKNNRVVSVRCYRYESFSKKIMQGVELRYRDDNIANKVSDEL